MIFSQPESRVVRNGTTAAFAVGANGSELRYEWRRGEVGIAGGTNATLTLQNVQPSAEGAYDVVISNGEGQTQSAAAQLTVCWNAQLTGVETNVPPRPKHVDSEGNIYHVDPILAIPPGSNNAVPRGFQFSKTDTNGAILWETSYRATNLYFGSYDSLLSSNRQMYLSGQAYSQGSDRTNYTVVVAVGADGVIRWVQQLPTRTPTDSFAANPGSVLEDSAGNIYVPGRFDLPRLTGPVRTNRFAFAKLSDEGELLWVTRPTNGTDVPFPEVIYPSAWGLDGANNVVVCGTSQLPSPAGRFSVDIVTSKISQNAEELWSRTVTRALSAAAYSLLIDENDDVFVSTYSYNNQMQYLDSFTAKYTANGGKAWEIPHPTWVHGLYPPPVTLDTSGHLYVVLATWHLTSFTPLPQMFVLGKYDPEGHRLWSVTNFLSETSIPANTTVVVKEVRVNGADISFAGEYLGASAGTFAGRYIENKTPGLPIIREWTAGMQVVVGEPFKLEGKVEGAEPVSFQWFFDGRPLAGETNASLEIAASGASDIGTYALFAQNAAGCALSENIRVFVLIAPSLRVVGFPVITTNAGSITRMLPVELQGQASQWYRIERSRDLKEWREESSLQAPTNGVMQFKLYSGDSNGFFRVRTF